MIVVLGCIATCVVNCSVLYGLDDKRLPVKLIGGAALVAADVILIDLFMG